MKVNKQPIDRNFCKDVAPGRCFSLILHIERANLVADLGLSTLALASDSKEMQARLDEACQAAWTDYKDTYKSKPHLRHRYRLVNHVEKMRCIYVFDNEPHKTEQLVLGENEIAFSVKLTKFGINGTTAASQLGPANARLTHASSYMAFRSVYIFACSAVSPCKQGWHPVEGIGLAPMEVKKSLNRDVSWNVDFNALITDIRKIMSDLGLVAVDIQSFADQAKRTIEVFKNTSNHLEAGAVLVGIGYNALQSLCKESPETCAPIFDHTDMTKDLKDNFSTSAVPSSESSELSYGGCPIHTRSLGPNHGGHLATTNYA